MTAPTALPPQVSYRDGRLFLEDVPLARIAADFGTPTYVYSRAALEAAYRRYRQPLALWLAEGRALICYAVKANSNLAVLDCFARAGAGFDIVSGGELARVLAAGGAPDRIVFSGVGKRPDEMRDALAAGIRCFNVESRSEARQLAHVAADMGRRAPVSLRINPDVDARTHPYIATGLKESKFGIAYDDALAAYREVASLDALDVVGVDCHIGSQLLDEAPLLAALDKLLDLVDRLTADGIAIRHIDIGGGVGILYGDEATPGIDVGTYLAAVVARLERWQRDRAAAPVELLVEPGRSLVGNAGVLLMQTLVLKTGETKNFAIVDAAMNDLMRPALYDAYHAFVPVDTTQDRAPMTWDIVGPVCESGDWLAHARDLGLAEGDLLVALSAGAYGMAMASNYNTRPRGAEVMVDGEAIHLVRERESVAGLFAGERLPR
jgi:diaminopimelate decarboxylase